MADIETNSTENQMGEGNQIENNTDNLTEEKTSWSKEEVEAIRKEATTSGYVKGKKDEQEKSKAKERQLAEEALKKAKLANMSEQEKLKAELEDYRKTIDEYKAKEEFRELESETRKLLKQEDVDDMFLPYFMSFKDPDVILEKIKEHKEKDNARLQKMLEARISTHVPKQNTEQPKNGLNLEDYRQRMLAK